jgi:hypothetical protein
LARPSTSEASGRADAPALAAPLLPVWPCGLSTLKIDPAGENRIHVNLDEGPSQRPELVSLDAQ